jgi:hypothetical protein
MNNAIDIPTFETIRGRSWIDLTLGNNKLAQNIRRWTCGEEESCSDHKLIFFDIEDGLKFEEETSEMLHLERGFVWC